MKKIVYSLSILGLALTSCNDYLEEENLSNVTAESFYVTSDGFETLINANYSQLREIYGDQAWLFCAGTDLYAEGRDQEPTGLSQYSQLNSSAEGVEHLYNTCYRAIQTANLALYYSDITESTSDLNNRIGEIQYLRANAYFLLVQTYGGVGLVNEYIDSPVLEFDRDSAAEVYNFIISELEDALVRVNDGGFNGRVNRRAVEHLLAKVYLTRGYESFGNAADFSTAATYADDAIGGQILNLPFADLWLPGNELNEEVVFSVQFEESSISTDVTNLGHRQANYFSSYLGGSEVAGDAPFRTFNLCLTDHALSLFENGDTRWEGSFMVETFARYYDFFDVEDHSGLEVANYYAPQWASSAIDEVAYLAINPTAVFHAYGTYGADDSTENYGTIPLRKFDDPSSSFGARNDDGRVSSRDIILSRLAETYLIAAEAYLQSGSASTGLLRLNEVRSRAGVADALIGEFDIDYILDERARELLGEYHRWFDLKRTGKLVERASMYHYLVEESNFNGASGELKILRPIPQEALDLNQNKDFPQNPAYN